MRQKIKLELTKGYLEIDVHSDSEELLDFFVEYANKMRDPALRRSNQKLDEEKVREIRRLHSESGWGRHRLSKKFGVGKSTIERVIKRQAWKDVE